MSGRPAAYLVVVQADLEFGLMATHPIQLNLAGREIVLDDVQRCVPRRPPTLTNSPQLSRGDTIRLVPGSSVEPTIAVLSVAGPE
ncbi:hypothetical protein ACFV0L_04065 [Streptosporangium canum]|uniref:hypothetical protein n=1 Tax=Streptosporangium canum TaxID=324952 RepID=UPI0036BB09BD